MINSFIFIFSFGLCYIQMLLAYKVERKISFIQSIILCFITQVCLGAIGAQILSTIHIYINLISMSIIYIVISLILFVFSIRKRKIQKFLFDRIEIFCFFTICVGVGIVFLLVFTPNILLAYQNSDPAVHLYSALDVLKNGKISTMYFASLYNALFIEVFQPFVLSINTYKLFILADTLANLFNVLMFFCVALNICKMRFVKGCLPVICFLYYMGWPFFNYAIGGFVYFGWGITLIAYVLCLLIFLDKCSEKKQQILLWGLVLVGCFCTLICYMLFVPTLAVIVLYALKTTIKKNEIKIDKFKRGFGIAGIAVIGSVSFIIAFYGFFRGNLDYLLQALQTDGWIHNELYKDFILLVPILVYMLSVRVRERNVNLIYVALIIVVMYIGATFIVCLLGVMSAYYYYKEYFVLWFISWLIVVDAIETLLKRNRIGVCIYSGIILLFSAIALLGIDSNVILRSRNLIPNNLMSGENPAILPLYGRTYLFLSQDREEEYLDKSAFIDVCEYLNENENNKRTVIITSSNYMGIWFIPFTGGERIWVDTRLDLKQALEEVKQMDANTVVIHQNTEVYRENKDLLQGNEPFYDNGYYGVYILKE